MRNARSHWNLYWVESDGVEDCFVVARNSRSARAVECHMNGFDFSEVKATRIARVPPRVVSAYVRQAEYKERPWPWYIYGKKFFQGIGASFRTVDRREEMLLGDIVYEVGDYAPCSIFKRRDIGYSALDKLEAEVNLDHDDEDIWPGREMHIITAIGMCLVRCQQIEDYITNSFLLGISKKQKAQYETFNDLKRAGREKL